MCLRIGRWNTRRRKKVSHGTTGSRHHGQQVGLGDDEAGKGQAARILSPLARSPEICGFRVETSGPYSRTYTRGSDGEIVQRSTVYNKTGECQQKDEHSMMINFQRSDFDYMRLGYKTFYKM